MAKREGRSQWAKWEVLVVVGVLAVTGLVIALFSSGHTPGFNHPTLSSPTTTTTVPYRAIGAAPPVTTIKVTTTTVNPTTTPSTAATSTTAKSKKS